MEQFRFFADSLRVSKMRTYVDMMVAEAEVRSSEARGSNGFNLKEKKLQKPGGILRGQCAL